MEDEQPNYEKLSIWQEAVTLALEIYKISSKFPKSELFGLTSQLRRASISISLNIAEGSGRSKKEFAHFLTISITSINEALTAMKLSLELGYITKEEYEEIRHRCLALIRQTMALRTRIQKSKFGT